MGSTVQPKPADQGRNDSDALPRVAVPGHPDAKRRKLARENAASVVGTLYTTLSTRGLDDPVVIVRRCCFCGRTHKYRSGGLRVAACRLGYVLIRVRRTRVPK